MKLLLIILAFTGAFWGTGFAQSEGTKPEVIIEGTATLLYTRTPEGEFHYYINSPTTGFKELIQIEKTIQKKNCCKQETYTIVQKPYIKVLATAFEDCPAIGYEELSAQKLKLKALARTFRKYNRCNETTPTKRDPGLKRRSKITKLKPNS